MTAPTAGRVDLGAAACRERSTSALLDLAAEIIRSNLPPAVAELVAELHVRADRIRTARRKVHGPPFHRSKAEGYVSDIEDGRP